MARWGLGSYNRFLGEAMTQQNLSRKEAAAYYRKMRDHLGHPVFRSDLAKHPRIAQREARQILLQRLPPKLRKHPPIPPKELPPVTWQEEEQEEEEEEWESSDEGEEYPE